MSWLHHAAPNFLLRDSLKDILKGNILYHEKQLMCDTNIRYILSYIDALSEQKSVDNILFML